MFAINENTRENLQKFRVWDFELDKFHYFSLRDLMRNWMNGIESDFKYDDVDLKNIQEFTGIMDSNRREVWEGDILEEIHYFDLFRSIKEIEQELKGSKYEKDEKYFYTYRGAVCKPSRLVSNTNLLDRKYGKYSKSEFITISLNSEEGKLTGCNIQAETKVIGNIYENIELCEYTEQARCCFVDRTITHYHWDNLENKQIQKYIKKG